jgi:hypothetical protein
VIFCINDLIFLRVKWKSNYLCLRSNSRYEQ